MSSDKYKRLQRMAENDKLAAFFLKAADKAAETARDAVVSAFLDSYDEKQP